MATTDVNDASRGDDDRNTDDQNTDDQADDGALPDALPDAWSDVIAAVADGERFVSASLTGARRGITPPAKKVTLRPVELRGGRHLQTNMFDGRRTEVTNLGPAPTADQIAAHVAGLLRAGYATMYVKSLDGDLQLMHSRKGVARLVRHRPTATTVDTAHDRTKPRLVEPDAPFLHAVGITDSNGAVKPSARAKYRQVERFLEILTHSLPDGLTADRPVHAVDLGCGSGVLTLATHHLLRRIAPGSTMVGVDTKADLMIGLAAAADGLGWEGIEFRTETIDEFEPATPPDLVIALHACDTATDDALAKAVEWRARVVLAAPCCQHDLQRQLDRATAPAGFDPLLRHGIVRERLGDLLTDSLRAEILRSYGYRTDIIEFVSTEHTAKNLMIRAVLTGESETDDMRGAALAVDRLSAMWGIEPALVRRLVRRRPSGPVVGPPSADGGVDP